MKRILILCTAFFLLSDCAFSKDNELLSKDFSHYFNYKIYLKNTSQHTSFKPYINANLDITQVIDSIYPYGKNIGKLKQGFFYNYPLIISEDDYRIVAYPLVNFSKGVDLINDKATFVNTRGFITKGRIGKNVFFFSSFKENQAIFPDYLHTFIDEKKVVPGQGYRRKFKETGYDYAMSSGNVTILLSNIFTIQFGHGKHFIGDGYRSLLLSDNTFNYPFLRIQSKLNNIQYTNLYTEFQDINYFLNNNIDNYDQMGYAKKYMSSHYLSYKLNKKLELSLFESVIWRTNHAPGANGFDLNYLNPVAMLRPIEFSINSPDNVLLGSNIKYVMPYNSYTYAQIILDEFSLNEIKNDRNWWGNKFGYQIGCKAFNAFSINNLTLQTEYNWVRPYTYAHYNPQQNYAHYNQPLAHPLGANFSETLFLANYWKGRLAVNLKLIKAKYGGSIPGDSISYGNDLYMSTGNFEDPSGYTHSGRPSDNDILMYQGNMTDIAIISFTSSYIINPKINLKIMLGYTFRDIQNQFSNNQTSFLEFGLKTDLFNYYYDF